MEKDNKADIEKRLKPIDESLMGNKAKRFRTSSPLRASPWQQVIISIVQNTQKIELRYALRSRKKSIQNNDDDIDYQVKRIRAMLAYLYSLEEDLKSSDEIDHSFSGNLKNYSCDNYALAANIIHGITIPKSYKQAISCPESKLWKQKMKIEIKHLVKNKT